MSTGQTNEQLFHSEPSTGLADFIARLERGEELSRGHAADFLGCLLAESSTDEQIAAALLALAKKGETVDELIGCAREMRSRALRVNAVHESFVDTAGTGSSSAKTFNVSTAAAFVIAGAGVPVAKHGNRGVTSRTGSSDVLQELGVRVDATRETTEKCLNEVGIGFMFAPLYHGSTRRVAAVRRQLGVRTIFNLLGPLTNPAAAPFQIVGVSQSAHVEPLARALAALGTKRSWVVHGADGLDEVTLADRTLVGEAEKGTVRTFELGPEDFGVRKTSISDLVAGDARASAELIRNVLCEESHGVARDLVMVNASAALFVAEAADSLVDAMQLAAKSIDTGAAAAKLSDLVGATNS